jgi:hypothetical protein
LPGTGKGQSVMEMIVAMEKATGRKVPYVVGPRRPGDLAKYLSNCTLVMVLRSVAYSRRPLAGSARIGSYSLPKRSDQDGATRVVGAGCIPCENEMARVCAGSAS